MASHDKVKTVVEAFSIPLSGPVYDGVHGTLFIEVRDFGEANNRTLVIRTIIEGYPVTTMVRWDTFVDEFDEMRGRMMSGDWDDALSQLIGGNQIGND